MPTAATVTFTLGIRSMEKHHLLVRRLQAVETLGAIQSLCMDKTGTITRNRMMVKKAAAGMSDFDLSREPVPGIDTAHDFSQLLAIGVLCNDARLDGAAGDLPTGSPTECALLDLAMDAGCDIKALRRTHPLLEVKHRAENRLYMSTIHDTPEGERLLAVKGSPAEVLRMCDRYLEGGEERELTESVRLEIDLKNARMAGEALRVLGAALKTGPAEAEVTEEGMTWVGLIGMADPIRPGVGDLIGTLHRAGIDTVMITGDQSQTAHAVAKEVGLSRGDSLEILDITQQPDISDEEMEVLSSRVHVFSRITPAQKLKIVRALQAGGKVVAMTGDGVNDGPALKAADIGIAMGRSGTDVARDVADVVIEKDDLETLVVAIRDGRTIQANIKKSVHFFLATNLSEILIMAGAIAGGLGTPLNTMQLLWINMISDILPGVALSMEKPEGDVLAHPPRAMDAPLFSRDEYRRMVFEASTITGGALTAYGYGLVRYGFGAGAGAMAFQSLTIGQLLHAFSCRSKTRSVFSGRREQANPWLTVSIGGSLALQGLTFFVPGLRNLLGLAAPSLRDLLVTGGTAIVPFLVNEATKPRDTEGEKGADGNPLPAPV
jgi:Ca2+-transporting ATPase